MIIGVPKEIKNHEYRVGLTPASAAELIAHGHIVVVEKDAGRGVGFYDEAYLCVGAHVKDVDLIWESADMIVKVKEPQACECARMHEGQILFTYLHLAPDPAQAAMLIDKKVVGIAYETVTDSQGRLPLLAPMSEVAGRMAPQVGAAALQKANGGRGILLGGVPGVSPAVVTIIGGGTVGTNAARIALGMGAEVTILDSSVNRLRELDNLFGGRVKTQMALRDNIQNCVYTSDMVIGAVLVAGASAPKLVTKHDLHYMLPGSVIVDVAIDQGGCFETSHATTHADPTYIVEDVVHYCVANMPGAVARTSTLALNSATLPYALLLADKGWEEACDVNLGLRDGLNVCKGVFTHPGVAASLKVACVNPW